jgi:exonuclease III
LFSDTKPHKSTTEASFVTDGNRSINNIDLITCNIEGAKSNNVSLQNVAKEKSALCIQEHWLWSFDENYFNKIIPQMECYIRCSDYNAPISNFQVPRGRGEVAILWPSERDKYIKKLTDGNERIIATEIQTTNKTICLINVYLPTKMTNSDNQYQENIDILQTMIDK